MTESWQIFRVAKKALAPGKLQNIYRRSTRQIAYWAANPRYTDKITRNPIDRIRILLEDLYLAGHGEYARWAIDYMAEPLGGRFTDRETAKTDKGSIEAEVADITMALGELVHELQEAGADERLDTVEKIRIKDKARNLIIQVEQLLDAAGIISGTDTRNQ